MKAKGKKLTNYKVREESEGAWRNRSPQIFGWDKVMRKNRLSPVELHRRAMEKAEAAATPKDFMNGDGQITLNLKLKSELFYLLFFAFFDSPLTWWFPKWNFSPCLMDVVMCLEVFYGTWKNSIPINNLQKVYRYDWREQTGEIC